MHYCCNCLLYWCFPLWLGYAWYLDGVSVYDMTDKRIYEFKCDAWLSGRDGDRQTYKDLLLDCERAFVEGMMFFVPYSTSCKQLMKNNIIWFMCK